MKNKENLLLLINPFERIAGSKALLIGLPVFIVSILLAYCGNMIFDGVLDAHFSNKPTLAQALLMPSIALAILIIILYITGHLLSKSAIRFIDVAGTITLSRAPYLIISLVVLIPGIYENNMHISKSLLTQDFAAISFIQWIVFFGSLIIMMISTIWFIILAYRAFSVSCNIKGAKGIIGFILALLISEIIAFTAIYQIVKCFFTV